MYALNPYLNFQGNAREAMEFYQQVFGGELTVSTFGGFGAVPEDHEFAGQVMHAALDGPVKIFAADHPEGLAPYAFVRGTNVNLAIMGDDESEVRPWFDRLADGGTVIMPLQVQMWGDLYGAVVDRFGIPWMFNLAVSQEGPTQ